MPNCLIGLGSNLGHRHETLTTAVRRLQGHPRIEIVGISSWHTFPAMGGPSGQNDFLNGVLRLDTNLTPHELAEVLQAVECGLGRERSERWAARTLDCDLLLFGTQQINTPTLQIPHPRMMTRRFVLEPAAEIAAEMTHPSVGWSIGRLLEHLKSATAYFAVTGSETTIVDRLARDLVARVKGQFIDGGSILPSDTSSSDWHRQLEFARQRSWLLRENGLEAKIGRLPDESPRISNFWLWQSLLCVDATQVTQFEHHAKELQLISRAMSPKLLIVTDPESSELGQALAAFEPELCVPTLHLSADPWDAIQDAVGAVLSMR